ncbi:copper chaperone PCu(A)C [Yoonia sp. R2331]|uniref:copper chaperone PCu(A)C n=1 Tax=Yoonia sp. R2331 TaxID=3237238 RepID=UPI0034E3D614
MRMTIAALLTLFATTLSAHDYEVGELKVMHPVARETAKLAQAGAGYLSIENTGDTADSLIAIEADFPRVMLHDTVMDGDVAKMEHLMSVPIAPGETVTFAPGGKHVMFMGLNGDPLEVGEEIPAVLIFENAGRLEVVFQVEPVEDDGHDHSGL